MLELSSTLSSHVRFLLQSLTEANVDSVFRELCQMEEFTEKEREVRTSSLTRKQPNIGSKETSLDEVLCRHKERKPFAYGLRNECYEEVSTHVPTRLSNR
ncbi:hypothetical protein ES319_D01G235600v1 [Gossypium barbadense]|uniref:Uncharacterized protein n=2 Tax=Gossypium TaxID=3633 RepID=A0A5J5SUM0_GOSBA|nr:hypothetical protein ES319_D01G235600v1 [Gossypium barbadense]TYG84458.1 hypothetical protein ES288_D01G252100v1 [Gossypium darwinii]